MENEFKYSLQVRNIPASCLKNWNKAADKLNGKEEYGDSKNDEDAWAIQFNDFEFNTVRVEGMKDNTKYTKTYKKEDIVGLIHDDELYSNVINIEDEGGVKVFLEYKFLDAIEH